LVFFGWRVVLQWESYSVATFVTCVTYVTKSSHHCCIFPSLICIHPFLLLSVLSSSRNQLFWVFSNIISGICSITGLYLIGYFSGYVVELYILFFGSYFHFPPTFIALLSSCLGPFGFIKHCYIWVCLLYCLYYHIALKIRFFGILMFLDLDWAYSSALLSYFESIGSQWVFIIDHFFMLLLIF